jgi:hypothetical protein
LDIRLNSFKKILSNILGNELALLIAAVKIWQLASGLITIVLIAFFLSSSVQGLYYTFYSIIAATAIFELGLHVGIVNFSSRLWSKLSLDKDLRIIGSIEAKRDISAFMGFCFRWYFAISIAFGISATFGGRIFLIQQGYDSLSIMTAWYLAAFGGALQLFLLPFYSFFEGCQKIALISKFRLFQAIIDSIILWCSLASGLGLWAIGICLAFRSLLAICFFMYFFRPFFNLLRVNFWGDRFNGKDLLILMQWKLALQAVVGYLSTGLYVPIILHFDGSVSAGRAGLTLQVLWSIQALGHAWIISRVPEHGMNAVRGNLATISKQIHAGIVSSSIIVGGLGLMFCISLLLFQHFAFEFSKRAMEPLHVFIFIFGFVAFQYIHGKNAQVRAFGTDLFFLVNFFGALATTTFIITLTAFFGLAGAAFGFSSSVIFVVLPLTLLVWHREKSNFGQGSADFIFKLWNK